MRKALSCADFWASAAVGAVQEKKRGTVCDQVGPRLWVGASIVPECDVASAKK